jgi:hypothetical protein
MANSGYVYLTSQELETLKNATKTSKSSSLRSLVDNILVETLIIEDDANVSVNADGAYVQAWLWIDNTDIKVKKTTRSRKVTL